MPLPVVALFPWLVGLFASTLGALFTWFVSTLAARVSVRLLLATAYLVASAALTVGVAVLIKGAIMAIRVTMPASLGAATYFLPANINLIMGVWFSMRVSHALYCWTRARLGTYFIAGSGGV